MNTPAYFCIDQVSTDNLLSASYINESGNQISINPNPTQETLYLDLSKRSNVTITNMQGIVVWSKSLESGKYQVPVTDWAKGIYLVSVNGLFAARVAVE